mmetsp:Transcript_793/g.1386  ORF Transcript_793/g.1386 Transcript_793/m.1386 type:complete len:326 (+) Transcript_793:217-1194(+)
MTNGSRTLLTLALVLLSTLGATAFNTTIAVSYAPGLCLSVRSGAKVDGTPIISYFCRDLPFQFFSIEPVPASFKAPGSVAIRPLFALSSCLTRAASGIVISACTLAAPQRWRLHLHTFNSTPGFVFESAGFAITVPGRTLIPVAVTSTAVSYAPEKLFSITLPINGSTLAKTPKILAGISLPYAPSIVWDVKGSESKDNTSVLIFTKQGTLSGGQNQKFAFEPVPSSPLDRTLRPLHAPTTCITTRLAANAAIGPIVTRPCVASALQRWNIILSYNSVWGFSFLQSGKTTAITVPFATNITSTQLITNSFTGKVGQVFAVNGVLG